MLIIQWEYKCLEPGHKLMVCSSGLLLNISIKLNTITQSFVFYNKATGLIKYVRVSMLLTCERHTCLRRLTKCRGLDTYN